MLIFPIGYGSIDIILLPYMLLFWIVICGNLVGLCITIADFIKNKNSFLSSYTEQIKKEKTLIILSTVFSLIFFIGTLYLIFDFDSVINLFYKIRCLYGRRIE